MNEFLNQHISSRATINALLSSRVYLNDSEKFNENLDEIGKDNNFSFTVDNNAGYNEKFTQSLSSEMFPYFNPISFDELFNFDSITNQKNAPLKKDDFRLVVNNLGSEEDNCYISDKYIIRCKEGVFKIQINDLNEETMNLFIRSSVPIGKYSERSSNTTYKERVELNKIIQNIEPRFSFAIYTSKIDGQYTQHLVFRGTEPEIKNKEGSLEVLKYFVTDYPNMSKHYHVLEPFINQLLEQFKESRIPNFEVTGHSLGGAMTDIFMEKNKNNSLFKNSSKNNILSEKKLNGYAFGNPFGTSFATKTIDNIDKNFDKLISQKVQKNKFASFISLSINATILISSIPVSSISNLGSMFKSLTKDWIKSFKIDEHTQFVSHDDSQFYTFNHNSDPVPALGALIYKTHGSRFIFNDKNASFSKLDPNMKNWEQKNKMEKFFTVGKNVISIPLNILSFSLKNTIGKFLDFKNHSCLNYVKSCSDRVDISDNSELSQAIRNVKDTLEHSNPFSKQDVEYFKSLTPSERIKLLREKSFKHELDKKIIFQK